MILVFSRMWCNLITSDPGKYAYFPGCDSVLTSKLANQYRERYFVICTWRALLWCVNSTKNKYMYSKEQEQQRNRVLTAKSALLSITMRTTSNHSWSPQNLATRPHAWQSCASSTWIGQKACGVLDGSWPSTRCFFHFAAFLFANHSAFSSLFSTSESSSSLSVVYSATTLQPSSDQSTIH